jgi:hypothetical protein
MAEKGETRPGGHEIQPYKEENKQINREALTSHMQPRLHTFVLFCA